ncbi:MAG: hypothetical protein ABI633_05530 [Burkholderiales bacterium]
MSAFDALNHLFNFMLPALVVGPLAAAFAKVAWRSELRAVRWRRMALWATGASALSLIGGLVVFGRDGVMMTYGAMVVASALALLWVGFGPGRR